MFERHAKWKLKLTTLIVVLFFVQDGSSESSSSKLLGGSVLFEDHGFAKKCFDQSDIAILSTRLKLQELLPAQSNCMLNDDDVMAVIKYFYEINGIVEKMSENDVRDVVQKSFYDMLGSYLKHQVLPITKFSFYSGNVTFTVAENLFNLYEHCKELLDTNGNGWADPISDFSQFKVNIEPLNVNETPSDDAMKACGNLAMNQNDQDNSDEDMLVALPKIETEDGEDLSMIWLPLKRKRVFNINSRSSSFILFRYFVMVSQCHNYQGIDQSPFNKKLKVWMTENVLPYLEDDTLYPAFGAALRILETVKGSNESGYQGTKAKSEYRKGSHKTLFDDDNDVSGYEFNSDGNAIDWMMNYALVASGALIALVFFIFLLVRACKRCRSGSSDNQKPSCLKKLKNFFLNRSHQHEPDEFYEYRKVSSGGERSVVFENEKKGKSFGWLRKSRTKRGKEKINLPLLGSHSDTDGDIEHHNSHSSKTSLDNRKKEKFKISESSDEGEKSKKLSKTSAKINQSASGEMKKGSSGKMRPRSPFRRGKN